MREGPDPPRACLLLPRAIRHWSSSTAWRNEEEVDAARHRQEKRGATRLGKLLSHTEASIFCEATPISLADESKEPTLYGRETDRDLRTA